jgi:hypothetical protein
MKPMAQRHSCTVFTAFALEVLMPEDTRVVAIGLLTASDLALLGPSFQRLYPVEDVSYFDELLLAIDEADRQLRDERTGMRS